MKKDFWLRAKKAPAILYGLGIMALSNQQKLPAIFSFSWFDKAEHMGEYFIFAGLVLYGWPRANWISGGVALAVFALSDELHQYFIPGRFSSVGDWVADIVGVSMCYGFWYMIRKNERL